MPDGVRLLGLAHVREVVLVALGERGDRGPEGGFAEQIVGLEGHRVERRRGRRPVRRAYALRIRSPA